MSSASIALLVGAVILAAAVGPAFAATAVPTDGSHADQSGVAAWTGEASSDAAALSDVASTDTAVDDVSEEIHPDLRNASGTVAVVVRLDDPDADTDAGLATEAGQIASLRRGADRTQSEVVDLAASTDDATVRNRFWVVNAVLLEVDADSNVLERVAALDAVDRIHPNYEVQAQRTATAPRSSTLENRSRSAEPGSTTREDRSRTPESLPATLESQSVTADSTSNATYGLDLVNATEAWNATGTRGAGATVAVVDTGVSVDHPDVDLYTENASDPTYPGGWAEFDADGARVEDSVPTDGDGHGTHVAGTVAGGDASGQSIGVAPDARLLAAKALDDSGSGTFASTVAAMEWAIEQDADVLSLSLGIAGHHAVFVEPVQNARTAGTLVVGASGNAGAGTSGSPANVYETTSVGAIDEEHSVAPFSSGEVVDVEQEWGPDAPEHWPASFVVPDLVAPGVEVRSAAADGGYVRYNGTSMATPHVAGVAALVSSAGADPLPSVLEHALETTAWKPADAPEETDSRYGTGIVDAAAATAFVRGQGVHGVVSSGGAPVANATVASGDLRARTDANGSFRLPLRGGNHTITVDGFGFESETVAVTVPDAGVANRSIDVDPTADAELLGAAPPVIEAGDTVDLGFAVANPGAVVPTLNDTALTGNATLVVEGEAVESGDRVSVAGDAETIAVAVETGENASGQLSVHLTVEGPGSDATVLAGPTSVVDTIVPIGVVAQSRQRADAIADSMRAELPVEYRLHSMPTENATNRLPALDAAVVQHLGSPETASAVRDAAEAHDVGLVLLEQWGDQADAITQYAATTGWPKTVKESGAFETSTVSYKLLRTHPLFDGVGAPDEVVPIHRGTYTDHAWVEGLGNARPLATVGNGVAFSGTGLAIDDDRNVVLAATLGRSRFVADADHTNASDRILSNAAVHVADRSVADLRPRTVTVDDAVLPANATREVAVRTSAVGVAGYQATVEFDPDVVEVAAVRGGDFGDPAVNVDRDAGLVNVSQANATGTDRPTLARIAFEPVTDGGAETAVQPVADETVVHGVQGEPIPTTFEGGTVELLDCEAGDVNRDGDVTAADATVVKRDIVDLPVQAPYAAPCADVTTDTVVTSGDVTRILRLAVGIDDAAGAQATAASAPPSGTETPSGTVARPTSEARSGTEAPSGTEARAATEVSRGPATTSGPEPQSALGETTVALSNATVPPGETTEVDVVVRGSDVAGFEANVTYDPDAVTLESVAAADFDDPTNNTDPEQGWVYVTDSSSRAVGSSSVVAATLTLRADAGAGSPLRLADETRVTDETGSDHAIRLSNGSLSVEEPSGSGADFPSFGGSEDGEDRSNAGDAPTDDADDGPAEDAGDGPAEGDSTGTVGNADAPADADSGENAADGTESEADGDGTPGFGPIVALAALLAVGVVLARRS